MRKRIKTRLKNRGGFTIGEVLVSVLILMMVFSIVAAGIPTAANAYYKVVDSANAQVLLSTTMTRLRAELSTATEVKCSDTTITYRCAAGSQSKIYLEPLSAGGGGESALTPGVWLQEYAGISEKPEYTHPLVSPKAASASLYLKYTKADYSGGVITFQKLQVMKGDQVLAEMDAFKVRVLTPAPETGEAH